MIYVKLDAATQDLQCLSDPACAGNGGHPVRHHGVTRTGCFSNPSRKSVGFISGFDIKRPTPIARKTPDHHQASRQNLADKVMQMDNMNAYPHQQRIKGQPDHGHTCKFDQGIAMPLLAVKGKVII